MDHCFLHLGLFFKDSDVYSSKIDMIISIIANIQKQNMNTDLAAGGNIMQHGKFPLTKQTDKTVVAELFIYKLSSENNVISNRELICKTGTLM